MKKSELKAIIKEGIQEVLNDYTPSTIEIVKSKVEDFIDRGENWTDSDYMEMTDGYLFTRVKKTNPVTRKAYKLIRTADFERDFNDNGEHIPAIKQQLTKLLPLFNSTSNK